MKMLANQIKPADNLVCTCLILMEGKDVVFQVNGPFGEKGFVIWNGVFSELEKKGESNITNNCNIVITEEQEQSFVQNLVITHPSILLDTHCRKQSLVDIWGQQPPSCTTVWCRDSFQLKIARIRWQNDQFTICYGYVSV